MPTTPTNLNMFGASPRHPRNILDDRHARVSLDRLISFQYTWKYQDGIFDGVVWVSQDHLDRTVRSGRINNDYLLPCWYSCIAENNGDQYGYVDDDGYTVVCSNSSHNMNKYDNWRDNWRKQSWYRKFVLFEMNAENMDRVMAGFCLKSVLCQTSLSVDHTTGVIKHNTHGSISTSHNIRSTIGPKVSAEILQTMPNTRAEFLAAGFHTNKLIGWFQR